MTSKKKELLKSIKYALVFTLVLAAAVFVVLEFTLRVLDVAEPRKEDEHHIYVRHAVFNPFLMWGPNVDIVMEQNQGGNAVWNSQGFRLDEELSTDKREGEYRIFALGGSTTENHFNFANLHYPQLAQEYIQTQQGVGSTTVIINTGVSGYSTAHTLVRLQFDILQYQPDMITVMHNYNDLTANYFDTSTPRPNYANKYTLRNYVGDDTSRTTKDAVLFILRQSRVLIAAGDLYKTIEETFQDKTEILQQFHHEPKVAFTDVQRELVLEAAFRNNLRSIVTIARQHDIDVVLLSQPAVFEKDKVTALLSRIEVVYPEIGLLKQDFEQYNRAVAQVAEETEAYFIDMYDLFGHDPKHFVDMLHYSPSGVERFAKIYSGKLLNILENISTHESDTMQGS